MYFRGVLIAALGLFVLGSCGGENELYQDKPVVGFKTGKTQCLENFGDTIEYYFRGDIQAEEMETFWNCFADSVDMFVTFTRGQQSDVFFAKELRNFLQRYFLGTSRVSDDLLDALMQLKRVFVGGSDQYFTKAELIYSKRLIHTLKGLSLEALPHIRLYTMKLSAKEFAAKYDATSFAVAMEVLKSVNARLGDVPQSHGESYGFDQLEILLTEMSKILSPVLNGTKEDSIRRLIPLLKKIKVVLIGENEQQVEGHEWTLVFDSIYLTYANIVRAKYFLVAGRWSYGEPFRQVGLMVNEVLRNFEQAILRKPNKTIPYEQFNAIFDEVDKLITWPMGLSLAAIKATWKSLIGKIFTPFESRFVNEGLGVEVLRSILFEFNHWHEAQIFNNNYVGHRDFVSEQLLALNQHFFTQPLDFESPEDEMKRIMFGPIPFLLDDRDRLRISAGLIDEKYDSRSLFVLNWQRVVVRLIVKAYARESERRYNLIGLTQEELGEAYEDFTDVAVAIGIANPGESVEDFVGSIYKLSALFMPRSNGDEIIHQEEAIEYTSFALAGVSAGSDFFDLAKSECGSLKFKKEEALEVECFRRTVRRYPGRYFGTMPFLLQEYMRLPEQDGEKEHHSKKAFLYFMEQAVRENGATDEPITLGDISQGVILAHYIETYMVLFDQDRDGQITLEESMVAFPRYKKILKEIAEFDSDSKTEALYTYLLKFAEKPESFGDKASFFFWMISKWRWKSISADRMMMMRILGLLATSSEKSLM